MNPSGDTIAATLLALLLTGGQFIQDRLDWRWQDWTLQDGKTIAGEMRDFDWDTKALVLAAEGDAAAVRVPAEDLRFWSKVRMLSSAPFHDRLLNHLEDLEKSPGYQSGVERLKKLGLIFVGFYAFLFCALNWMLAGWILRSGSILRWLESGVAFVVLSGLCGWMVFVCARQAGSAQILEYAGLAAFLHGVLYLSLVWAIYQAGPWRPMLWYALCWVLALCLPLTLGGTALMAQVHRQTGALDLAAWDTYLTEVWLRPMGLL